MKKFLCNVSMIVCIFSGMNAIIKHAQAQCMDCNTSGCDSLASVMGPCAFATNASDASGNHSVAMINGAATGQRSFAVGESAFARNLQAVALGRKVIADAPYSMVFGRQLIVDSTATNSIIIGYGEPDVIFNDIPNSIMMGMNSTEPTLFIQDGGGLNHWGRVGIGTTDPIGLLHLKEETGTINDLVLEKYGDTQARVRFQQGTSFIGHLSMDDAEDMHLTNRTNNRNILFNINQGSTQVEAMRIVGSSANVGIGVINPQAKLQVNGDAVSGAAEVVSWFKVSDALGDGLQIRNGSTTNGEFVPTFLANSASVTQEAFRLVSAVNNDPVGNNIPAMVFQARFNDLGTTLSITNRPLFQWRNHGLVSMTMLADGNLGIGTTTPSGRLHVAGTVFVNPGSVPASATVGGSLGSEEDLGINVSSGQIINLSTSSIHFKEYIENIEFDKEAFQNLRPVDYNWKEFYGGHSDVGLIAQEVAETFPPLASWSHKRTYLDNGDLLRDSMGIAIVDTNQMEVSGVRYHKLPVYLLAIVKDQQNELSELRQQVQQLTEQVSGCCVEVGPMHRLDGSENVIRERNEDVSEFVLLRNDPNPFNDYSDIRYEHDGCTRCEIIITDMSGKIVKRILTSSPKGTVRIYSSEIGSGLFIYSLIKDGQTVRSGRMVSSSR